MGYWEGSLVFSLGAVLAALLLFSLSQPLSPTPGPLVLAVLFAGWIVRGTGTAGQVAFRRLVAVREKLGVSGA